MLNGKVAVVTGASRGIGRAVAIRLASEGATVVINYNGSRERAEEVKAEIEQAGGKAEIKQCNVSDYKACEEMFKEIVSELGSVDILVNNAGITRDGLLMKVLEELRHAVTRPWAVMEVCGGQTHAIASLGLEAVSYTHLSGRKYYGMWRRKQ